VNLSLYFTIIFWQMIKTGNHGEICIRNF